MAARSKAAAPAPSLSLSALQPSPGLKPGHGGGRSAEPNPLSGAVVQSIDNPLMLPCDGPEGPNGARAITNMLRRDAGDDVKLHIQYQNAKGERVYAKREKDENGKERTVYPADVAQVHFVAKTGRTKRAYTADDIRAWHKEQTGEEITGKVPPAVREAFKAARAAKNSTSDETADSAA